MADEGRPEIKQKTGVVTVGETWSQGPVVETSATHETGNIDTFGERKDEGEKDASSHSAA
jgi:hypothetical protein